MSVLSATASRCLAWLTVVCSCATSSVAYAQTYYVVDLGFQSSPPFPTEYSVSRQPMPIGYYERRSYSFSLSGLAQLPADAVIDQIMFDYSSGTFTVNTGGTEFAALTLPIISDGATEQSLCWTEPGDGFIMGFDTYGWGI